MNARRWSVIGAALLGLSGLAAAAGGDSTLARAISDVERAYARHSFPLDPVTHQKMPSATNSTLFPGYGYPPVSRESLSWSLTAIDADQSVLCLSRIVQNKDEWNSAIATLSNAGLRPASARTCSPASKYSLAPAQFPATLAGVKVLDRRDVLSPTYLPAAPVISGVDGAAVTRPGLVLKAGGPAVSFFITNPYAESASAPQNGPGQGNGNGHANGHGQGAGNGNGNGQGKGKGNGASTVSSLPGASRAVTGVSARPGFFVQSSCGTLDPGTVCEVRVSYPQALKEFYVGQLVLEFSNGAVANIGLAGQK